MALLEVKDLRTYFHTRNGIVKAVDGVSFSIEKGETLGIVGESGSGKSVSCYSLMGLIPTPPGKVESGSAKFGDVDLLRCSKAELRNIRGKKISMIFQDPMSSLNPYMRIIDQLMEPLLVHGIADKKQSRKLAVDALKSVGILDPETRANYYPHEFSGGMRQRVMIAMAIITKPDLLIADEPTTALDVTVQAQVVDLIKKMQKELGMGVIFITHDLGLIARACDRVVVMYGGKIMESSATEQVFYSTKHPYTRALLRSIPSTHKKGEELYTIRGMPPDVSKEIRGCPFAPRCDLLEDRCQKTPIDLRQVASGHYSSCFKEVSI